MNKIGISNLAAEYDLFLRGKMSLERFLVTNLRRHSLKDLLSSLGFIGNGHLAISIPMSTDEIQKAAQLEVAVESELGIQKSKWEFTAKQTKIIRTLKCYLQGSVERSDMASTFDLANPASFLEETSGVAAYVQELRLQGQLNGREFLSIYELEDTLYFLIKRRFWGQSSSASAIILGTAIGSFLISKRTVRGKRDRSHQSQHYSWCP